jgi:ammonia channel protein AmtB
MACNGMLAGLVAITADDHRHERVTKIDDPCGVISVHGFCGWLGVVSVSNFADGTYPAAVSSSCCVLSVCISVYLWLLSLFATDEHR